MLDSFILKRSLEKSYDIIRFDDISSLTVSHGKVFNLFKSLYKEHYKDNERIIFYSSFEPSDLVLEHIQRAAIITDIPGFFILICTPFDLDERLNHFHAKHNGTGIPITSQKINLKRTGDLSDVNLFSYDSFCPAPFNMAFVDLTTPSVYRNALGFDGLTDNKFKPSAVAYPCCKIDIKNFEEDSDCKLPDNSLSEALRGKSYTDLQNQFRKNSKPSACGECWRVERTGGTSFRKHNIEWLTQRSKKGTNGDFTELDDIKVRYLQIIPSITCNFKCRICNNNFSSSIAIEDMQFTKDEKVKQALAERVKERSLIDINFYKNILDRSLNDLTELTIYGGEPTLMKNLPELLTYIIDQGHNDHINLTLSTNCGAWSAKLPNLIKQFKTVAITFSIDNIGDRFNIERGGIWKEAVVNINKWLSLDFPNIRFAIAPTVNVQNVLYLEDVINFAKDLGVDFGWNYLERPSELCIDNLTQEAKQLVYNKYKDHQNIELRNIANRVIKTPNSTDTKFVDLMNMYDERRGTNFKQTHKEIYDAMLAK